MNWLKIFVGIMIAIVVGAGREQAAGAENSDDSKRLVLVELFTSQGCDMCPAAEKLFGALAEREGRIVPIAFHVDYFNNPWKDVFSDHLYSQRQMNYNELYTKPKNPQYGLYYTPMLMIDGQESVNGQDAAAAEAAIRRALAQKPAVSLDIKLDKKNSRLAGTADIKVTSRSVEVEKTPLLLCAVLRDDNVITAIASGENGGKSLVARYPARQTKYDFIELDDKTPVIKRFTFSLEPGWKRQNLRLAVFVQNKRTGAIYQAADIPWQSEPQADKAARSTATTLNGPR